MAKSKNTDIEPNRKSTGVHAISKTSKNKLSGVEKVIVLLRKINKYVPSPAPLLYMIFFVVIVKINHFKSHLY